MNETADEWKRKFDYRALTNCVLRERARLLLLLLCAVDVYDVLLDDLGLEQLLVVGLAVDHALVAHVSVQSNG